MLCLLYPVVNYQFTDTMVLTQLRPQRLTGLASRHVKATRCFSTSAALRKEIQDAYILSAARTPTAKVRSELPFHMASITTDSLVVQWLLRLGPST